MEIFEFLIENVTGPIWASHSNFEDSKFIVGR
jgi:hypothetical protein